MKKPLGYFQIEKVVSDRGDDVPREMRAVSREPQELEYRALSGQIELPKRKKGEKFRVLYTVMYEQEF